MNVVTPLLVAVVLALAGGGPALGLTIEGKVISIAGDEIAISYQGDWAPRVGDPVTVGFLMDNELVPVAGDWRVTGVDAEQVRASASGGGAPGVGYLARIQSANPQSRSSLVAQPEEPSSGSAEDLFQRGVQYADGEGVAKDEAAAVEWFRKAAEMGHAGAQRRLGQAFQNGSGVQRDLPAALGWFEKAAAQGLAEAQNDVAFMVVQGLGCTKDEVRALQLFQKAADQGYAAAISNLGVMFEKGMGGLAQDLPQAVAHYRRASEMGYALATRNLGMLYETGLGVPQSRDKAVELLQEAARQGNNQAQSWLEERGYSW